MAACTVAVTERDGLFHTVRSQGEHSYTNPTVIKRSAPKSKMSFWSRHDPVLTSRGQSDHWANLRVKSGSVNLSADARRHLSRAASQESSRSPKHSAPARIERVNDTSDSRAKRVEFLQAIQMDNNGNPSLSRSHTTTQSSRRNLRTAYNEKAKAGFKFWYQERPRPTQYGRYSIGSYKTFLGLGFAPRS